MTKQYNIKYKEWLKDSRDMNIITIFTPTYNRANLIQRVYECLLNQTDKRFVWILVNDGSKDNSDEVAEEILEKNELPILFISKSNGGKHSAFEVAFNEVRTEYFMCMDDDDIYSPKAVATYLGEWDYIKQENKFEKIGAIRTITQEEDGTIVSRKPFNKSFLGTRIDQTTLESNYIKHEYFENWTCYRTGALHSVDLFPKHYWMHDQHKFFSEGIWQGRFARKYQCRYYFVVLREYRHDTETSIIRGHKSRQHYVDMFINTKMILDEHLDYIKKSPSHFIQDVAIVSILRHKLGISLKELLKNTKSVLLKCCFVLAIPLAYLARNPKISK
ncbi:glycosyltransferase family 2 protein [Bacteroides sp. L008]|uniref:glycosyltransferase family 2 protein n=1 Tax=Bacteroides sp. L008 TaxID=3162404 RepID=UPI003465365B